MEKNQQGRIKKTDLLSTLKRYETEKEKETKTETKKNAENFNFLAF